MQRRPFLGALGLFFLGSAAQLCAAEVDPTGTWKWTATNPNNNQSRDVILKLKLDGETLSGSVPGPNNSQINIENATFKDGKVAFTVTRERNNEKVTQKFSGKLDGDTITGTIENANGRSREWVAKREKS